MSKQFEFFFDIGSPYSYLASTQLQSLEEVTGASVRWRPFLLGGVFRAAGNEMPARVPAKARWMLSDLVAWAALYGVPFRMSSHFPLNTLSTQRALIGVEQEHGHETMKGFAVALFAAYWSQDLNISESDVIAQIASDCGLDGQRVLNACATSENKSKLRADTDEAVDRGAFGAPSLFWGEQLFFGNDRFQLLTQAIQNDR